MSRWESVIRFGMVRFGVFLFVAIFGLAALLRSQARAEPQHGALELTSGLGRKLYSLPDDESVINARKSLAAFGRTRMELWRHTATRVGKEHSFRIRARSRSSSWQSAWEGNSSCKLVTSAKMATSM
jgi:hypothetical protein